jgi:hypothetical protein
MATITFYGSNVQDSTLTTACDCASASGGTETSVRTTSASPNNFVEVCSHVNSLTGVTAIPATPTGRGWLFLPGAGTFATGNWSATITLSLVTSSIGASSKYTVRFFKYNGSTYTSIGTINSATVTVNTKTAYSFAATSMSTFTTLATDYVYTDLWWNDTTNVGGDDPTVYVSTSSTAGVTNDLMITTSTFTPSSTTNTFTAPSESVSLSEIYTIIGLPSLSESNSLSEILAFGGNPATIDTVSVLDLSTLVGKATIASESVSIGESTLLAGVPMPTENVSLLEVTTSQLGSFSTTDSASLSEVSNPTGITSIASESVQPGENTPALVGKPFPTDSVSLADLNALSGATSMASENVGLGESTLLSGVPMPIDSVSLADASTLQGVTSIAPDAITLGESTLITGKPSVTDAAVQPGESGPSLVGMLSNTDGAAIADATNLLGTTSIAPDSALPSDSSTLQGGAQSTDSAALTDQTNLVGSTQIASESVALGDSNSQSGQPQNFESILPSENDSHVGSTQSSDSVQLLELPQLTSQSQIVEIVSLSDQYTALGSTQIAPDTVQLSELLNLLGLIQSTDSVSLGETVSYFSAVVFIAPPEGVALSDSVSMAGSTQQVESVPISEQYTLQGGMVIVPEQVTLSELLQMVGVAQSIDSAQLSEQYSLLGSIQATDSVQLSELIPVIISGGTAIFIAPPDSVRLSESLSTVGSIKVVESVQLADTGVATIFPATNLIFYARGGDITIFTRQGQTDVYVRSGDIKENSRAGNAEVFTRSGNITLNEE